MYLPPHFRDDDLPGIHAMMQATRLPTLVTATADGLIGTPLPLILDMDEAPQGVLYGHVSKANPQWKTAPQGDAMAIFMGPDAYVSPSWYATKQETGKVVPTWNYVAVHAYGPVEFFEDDDRLLQIVTRLTEKHEQGRDRPWAVSDAPEDFVRAQLKGIVGLRLQITRLDAKRKVSQNRSAADRAGVAAGLSASADARDRAVAGLIPR